VTLLLASLNKVFNLKVVFRHACESVRISMTGISTNE